MPHAEVTVHPYARDISGFVHTGDPTHVAVKIRLKRIGKIRTPHYRIVVMDSRKKRDGRAIEEVGQYHPKNDPSIIKVDSERVQYWLGVGAQATAAVVAILKRTGDWQKYSGDTSPSGIDEQPAKADKLALFNAALAEVGSEPTSDAIDKKADKKADKKSDDKKSDDKKSEKSADKAKADEAKADEKPAKDFGEGSYTGDTPPEGFTIKGNADSMKYHTTESPWYDKTVAEVWFNSTEAAEKAGFAAAGEKAED